jgi:hypothetical protein
MTEVATTEAPVELTNDQRLAETNKLIRKLGTESAHSALAKPKMALAIAQARADGLITDDAGSSTYDTYLEGRRAVLAKSALGAGNEDGGSYKANVSKNTQIIKAAGLVAAGVDFLDVLARTAAVRENLVKADEKVKAPFDAIVDVARAQLKSPEAALDDDAITGIVRKKEAAEKDLIAKLVDDYKRIYKRAEEFPCQALSDAVANIGDAINEAGGEVPPMTKDEKEAAAAMAFMTKAGFTVTKTVAAA